MEIMSNGIFSKFKNWMTEEDDYYEEDELEDELEETEEETIGNDTSAIKSPTKATAASKVVNLHGVNQMKVVIVEPKKYEDVTVIADHLKQKKAVIVNLEGLAQDVDTRKAIFYFMSGAVYVLDGRPRRRLAQRRRPDPWCHLHQLAKREIHTPRKGHQCRRSREQAGTCARNSHRKSLVAVVVDVFDIYRCHNIRHLHLSHHSKTSALSLEQKENGDL